MPEKVADGERGDGKGGTLGRRTSRAITTGQRTVLSVSERPHPKKMVLPSFSAALLASARATAAHHSRRPLTTTHLLRSYGRSLISTRSALYGRPRAAASSSSSSFASPLWGLHDPSGRFFSTQGTGKAKTEEEIEDEYEQELDREDDAHTKTEEGEKEFEEQQIKEQGWKEVWIPRCLSFSLRPF